MPEKPKVFKSFLIALSLSLLGGLIIFFLMAITGILELIISSSIYVGLSSFALSRFNQEILHYGFIVFVIFLVIFLIVCLLWYIAITSIIHFFRYFLYKRACKSKEKKDRKNQENILYMDQKRT